MTFDLIGFNTPANGYDLDVSDAVFPVSTRPLAAVGRENSLLGMPDHKAVIGLRGDKVLPLGVVGKDYKVMPNKAYYGTIETALDRAIPPGLREGVQVRTQLSNEGAWSRREYVFPAFTHALRNTEFETEFGLRVIAFNSYDGSASAGLIVGLIDFYCTNGVVMGRAIDQSRRRHTSGFTPDYFVPLLETNIERIQREIGRVEEMMHRKMDAEAAQKVLTAHFSERRAKALTERLEQEAAVRGWNVFALHSALTFYASHNSEQFAVRNTGNDNVARTLQGREDEVLSVLQSPEFRQLMAA